MRAVLQRVKTASVSVAGTTVGAIGKGLLVLLGVGQHDMDDDVAYLITKTVNMRVFEDAGGLMNLSITEAGGQVLVVSQFTLYGDCRKGRRPSFSEAAEPGHARMMYEHYIIGLKAAGLSVACGTFQAMMDVALVNDGPVTLLLDSSKLL